MKAQMPEKETINVNNLINSVLLTLESISVSGADNMSKLLGCINALKELQNGRQNDQ